LKQLNQSSAKVIDFVLEIRMKNEEIENGGLFCKNTSSIKVWNNLKL